MAFSYIITVLGWISFVVGIFVKRLAGLEALLTLQFSWLTIVWLNCYWHSPFTQTYPLKFTAGLNFGFIPDDESLSFTPPHIF